MTELHVYRRWRDVRLVFAPEATMANLRGWGDRVARRAFDFAVLRIYDHDEPMSSAMYLPMEADVVGPRDLLFVVGYPGSTDRFTPYPWLLALRDQVWPVAIEDQRKAQRRQQDPTTRQGDVRLSRRPDPALFVAETLQSYRESLLDPRVWDAVQRRQRRWLDLAKALPDEERVRFHYAWARSETAAKAYGELYPAWSVTEGPLGPMRSPWFQRLRARLRQLTTDERAEDAHDGSSIEPVPPDELERLVLGFENWMEVMGRNDPWLQTWLAGSAPRARLGKLFATSRVSQPEFWQELREGEVTLGDRQADPLVTLVAYFETTAEALSRRWEEDVRVPHGEALPVIQSAWAISQATPGYPDEDLSLRVSFGRRDDMPPAAPTQVGTPLRDLWAATGPAGEVAKRILPRRWSQARERVALATRLTMLTSHDVGAGNAGSPLLTPDGAMVGMVVGVSPGHAAHRFAYVPGVGQAVSLRAAAVLHLLTQVYHADRLVDALTRSGAFPAAATDGHASSEPTSKTLGSAEGAPLPGTLDRMGR